MSAPEPKKAKEKMSKEKLSCEKCSSNSIVKRGFAKNKLQTLQKYCCKGCKAIFTMQQAKGKTYPLNIILNAISTYNLGYTLEKTAEKINKKYSSIISAKTISNWVNEYKNTCTFRRLRKQAIKQYSPKTIIRQQALSHIQPYTFKFHKAKLEILTKENPQFAAVKYYLEKINSKEFPHHIFTYNDKNYPNRQRASQIKFSYLEINHTQKQNQANQLAKLALNLSNSNKERHESIQDFS